MTTIEGHKPGRILVVPHRTAATPLLLDEVRRRAQEGFKFDLLVPDLQEGDDPEATRAMALPLLEEAAAATLEAFTERGSDPWEALRRTVESGRYDEVIISTVPLGNARWLEHDLPSRARKLGVPVTVITTVGRGHQHIAPPAIR